MLFYLFSAEEIGELFERLGYPFEYETISRNIAYYANRSALGSTLSRVVYAWVLARSDRQRAMNFFAEALQSDVSDVQQGTTAEGIDLGAMAGTVDLVQRVSTGIEVRGHVLRLNPELPQEMERLDMRIRYRGHSLHRRLTRHSLTVASVMVRRRRFPCAWWKDLQFVSVHPCVSIERRSNGWSNYRKGPGPTCARDIMTAQVVAVKPGTRVVPEVARGERALPCCQRRFSRSSLNWCRQIRVYGLQIVSL